MRGIAAYGVYVPYWRLDRKTIASALGVAAASGTRSVASYDEDTTSLGAEAARGAAPRPRGALLRDRSARVPRQDQRHGDPRRPRPRAVDARLRHGGRRPL